MTEEREIELEVRCQGCGLLMTPSTTDWEMFRKGIHLHDALPCYKLLDARALREGWQLPRHTDPIHLPDGTIIR